MIPKIIHQIWLGDKSIRPDNLMRTWQELNPSWEYKLWTEDNIPVLLNQSKFDLLKDKYNGKSDILRYELLCKYGGVYIDADSKATRPLPDTFLNTELFACWENEKVNPGMISNGYLGSIPNNFLIKTIIDEIYTFDNVLVENISCWRITGPRLLTNVYNNLRENLKNNITIFPSWYFIPTHYSGIKYNGPEIPYAEQYWGTTKNIYHQLKHIL